MTGPEDAARQAAEALVGAFATHDKDRYFAAFAPDATFLFHTTPRLLRSRAEYRSEWEAWEADGFRVESCESLDARYQQVSDDVVVLTHRVRTRLAGVADPLAERETIVLARQPDGRWLGVHEHLSPEPEGDR